MVFRLVNKQFNIVKKDDNTFEMIEMYKMDN